MENNNTKCDAKNANEINLPDGEYSGNWSGYVVTFDVSGETHKFDTDTGVRGLKCPVRVVIKNNEAQVFHK